MDVSRDLKFLADQLAQCGLSLDKPAPTDPDLARVYRLGRQTKKVIDDLGSRKPKLIAAVSTALTKLSTNLPTGVLLNTVTKAGVTIEAATDHFDKLRAKNLTKEQVERVLAGFPEFIDRTIAETPPLTTAGGEGNSSVDSPQTGAKKRRDTKPKDDGAAS